MTTTVTTDRTLATANGTAPIPFYFQAVSAAEVGVLRNNVPEYGTFTVALNGDGTGTITPLVSWNTDAITVFSDPNFQQSADFTRFGPFYPDQITAVFDRIARGLISLKGRAATSGADATLRTDLAASAGSSLVGFKAKGSSAVVRSAQDKGRDVVSLRDFGAVLNSLDSDEAAWTKLYTAYPTGGVRLILDGYCRINSPIAPPAGFSNAVIDFGGGGYFYNPSHGFDFLHLPTTVAGWQLQSPRFFTDTGASGATGRFFLLNESNDLNVRDFWGRNCWNAISNSGAKVHLNGLTYLNGMKAAAGIGIVVDMGTNEVFRLENLYAENSADCLAGLQVFSGGSIMLGGTAAKCGTPLLVAPPAGKIVATLGLWPFFNGDTSSGNGARFTGAGVIQRVEGVFRGSSNAGQGLYIDVSPQSADLQVRAVMNGGNGVFLASGGTQYNSRYRVMAFGNTLSGVNVANNATNFSLDVAGGSGDAFGGNGRYSLEIGTGSDHFDARVVGAGDGLGLLLNGSGTSATKVITSRN